MSTKKIIGMNELLEAVGAAINSAAPSRRDALAKIMTAYREDSRDEYRWATGPQAPTLLSRLMMAVTPNETRNLTPMRRWLYNACLKGVWPIKCIEGFENWETGPIRFFYGDLKNEFHTWCKRNDILISGRGERFSKLVLAELHETLPQVNTRLRCKPCDGYPVRLTTSAGQARAVELPSLIDCRKNFDDRVFGSPQDWPGLARNGGVVVPGFIRLKEFAKLADMLLSSLYLYHSRKLYGFPRAERKIGRVKLWDESAAVAWIQKHKAARRNAQAKQTRDQTSVRDFLYKACLRGQWPVQCIEGHDKWEDGPIRFFYDDFKDTFHAWRKHAGIAPGGMGRANSRILLNGLTETFPQLKAHLRLKPADDSLVHRSPSDGRARVIELPSLAVCRANFDRIFKIPQDWNADSSGFSFLERARKAA